MWLSVVAKLVKLMKLMRDAWVLKYSCDDASFQALYTGHASPDDWKGYNSLSAVHPVPGVADWDTVDMSECKLKTNVCYLNLMKRLGVSEVGISLYVLSVITCGLPTYLVYV